MIGNELTAKQSLVIALLASGLSITEVAKRAKVGEATIYRWQLLSHFKTTLQQARDDIRTQALELLKSQTLQSVETIVTLRDDTNVFPQYRLKAAQLILEMTMKAPAEQEQEQDGSALDLRVIMRYMTVEQIAIIKPVLVAAEARKAAEQEQPAERKLHLL